MDGLAGGSISNLITLILLMVVPLVFAITFHEVAHGWVAKVLGDKTAYLMGRVSLNPARHIDWFGTIVLPLVMIIFSMMTAGVPFLFGWAKPVPVNWDNLRQPRLGKALVALAGPVSNIIMAVIWGWVVMWAVSGLQSPGFFGLAAKYFYLAGRFGVMINAVLCFLNLIPLPPLDGSRVISAILPNRWAYQYERLEPYGIWVLLLFFVLGGLRWLIYPPVSATVRWIFNMAGIQ